MARCVMCRKHIEEGDKGDIGVCFICETQRVKGQTVIAEVGLLKRLTGRTFVVKNDTIKKQVPGHTEEDRIYFMPKKQFKSNIDAVGGSFTEIRI